VEYLTPRQKIVLDLKLQGWSNSDIGRKFEIHRERVRQIVDQIGERIVFARKEKEI
jgi:DNA-binding CsgD family transcriptional regulator